MYYGSPEPEIPLFSKQLKSFCVPRTVRSVTHRLSNIMLVYACICGPAMCKNQLPYSVVNYRRDCDTVDAAVVVVVSFSPASRPFNGWFLGGGGAAEPTGSEKLLLSHLAYHSVGRSSKVRLPLLALIEIAIRRCVHTQWPRQHTRTGIRTGTHTSPG